MCGLWISKIGMVSITGIIYKNYEKMLVIKRRNFQNFVNHSFLMYFYNTFESKDLNEIEWKYFNSDKTSD